MVRISTLCRFSFLCLLAIPLAACSTQLLPDDVKYNAEKPVSVYKLENMRLSFADRFVCVKYTRVGPRNDDWVEVPMSECIKRGITRVTVTVPRKSQPYNQTLRVAELR